MQDFVFILLVVGLISGFIIYVLSILLSACKIKMSPERYRILKISAILGVVVYFIILLVMGGQTREIGTLFFIFLGPVYLAPVIFGVVFLGYLLSKLLVKNEEEDEVESSPFNFKKFVFLLLFSGVFLAFPVVALVLIFPYVVWKALSEKTYLLEKKVWKKGTIAITLLLTLNAFSVQNYGDKVGKYLFQYSFLFDCNINVRFMIANRMNLKNAPTSYYATCYYRPPWRFLGVKN